MPSLRNLKNESNCKFRAKFQKLLGFVCSPLCTSLLSSSENCLFLCYFFGACYPPSLFEIRVLVFMFNKTFFAMRPSQGCVSVLESFSRKLTQRFSLIARAQWPTRAILTGSAHIYLLSLLYEYAIGTSALDLFSLL